MSISLNISPRIIPNVASLYNDVNRIFMEYIDNSLDDAENIFDDQSNSYSRPIKISLERKGDSYKDGEVIISDNCCGIKNFTKVVKEVGNSDKKAQPWTNGQFGYGIYSFMAACGRIEITSKLEGESAFYIPINKKQFEVDRQEDVKFPNPAIKTTNMTSGTQIILSEFDKYSWKQINMDELVSEIETHFDALLNRNNLKIEITDSDNNRMICKPTDYEQFEGIVYEDNISKLTAENAKLSLFEEKNLKKPIHVYLKIVKGKTVNKKPVFVLKGRRIGEIKDIRSFKSNHKADLWNHPNLTGFIDIGNFLEPNISRLDFKNNKNSKMFFTYLIEEIEPLVHSYIDDVNKQSEQRHYRELEDRLNEALSKLAKIDSMIFRTDYVSGKTVFVEPGDSGNAEVGAGEKGGGGSNRDGDGSGSGSGGGASGSDKGNSGDDSDAKDGRTGNASNIPSFEDTGHKSEERKKSGFNIRIDERDPDIDIVSNKPLRSNIYGNEIRIFKKHPDFEERVRSSRKGTKKISQRLITYLAGEITVHYKDKFHNKHGQPEYNKDLFVGLVDFIYRFEQMLSDLEGKDLSDLG